METEADYIVSRGRYPEESSNNTSIEKHLSKRGRATLFDMLSTITQDLLLRVYGTSEEFITAHDTGLYEKHSLIEEACITYEFALEFEPSAYVVLKLLTELTGRDYIAQMNDSMPIIAARGALEDALNNYIGVL